MQSADFDEDLYKNWFRRPTLFVACAWFLLAVAGRILVRAALGELALLAQRYLGVDARAQVPAAVEIVFQMGVLALPVLRYMLRHPGVEQSMRVRAPHPVVAGYAAGLAVAAVPLCSCLTGWWTLLIRSAGGSVQDTTAVPLGAAALCIALLLKALLPGVCEELMFRGGIMGAWERRGTERALVISTLAFAALHGSVQGLPVQLLMGFSLGWLVIESDSLWTGVIFHVAFNGATVALSSLLGVDMDLHIYAITAPGPATTLLIADTVAAGALFGLMLIGLKALCGRLVTRMDGPKQLDLTPLEPHELVVLLAGALTAAVCYMEDILRVCGVL